MVRLIGFEGLKLSYGARAMTFALLLALALAADDGGGSTTRPNLLRAARVTRSDGCPNVTRIADGVASTDGDVWDSPRAALLAKDGVVEWDLGAVEPVAALRIQADNNDRYLISGSMDGQNWTTIWVAQPVELPGVQTRTSPELSTQTRYLRLTAEGGDSMYSIAELELFDSTAALVGAQLQRIAPPPPPPPAPAPPFDSAWLVVLGVTFAIVAYFRWVAAKNRKPAPPPADPPAAA
jgi:hypothetical protein